ncbi:MAG TPA: cadherin domain-containing protein [Allosphingosinicella sp.]|jgi:hypothetical protein
MPSFVRSGAPIGVNSQTASSQNKSSITALADGGFVVTWQTTDSISDGYSGAIKSQRYSAQGVAVGTETLVNNLGAGEQAAAQTAALANGGYVVTWQTGDTTQDGSGTAVKARLFDSSGAAVGGEFRVNSQTLLDQKDPTVAGLTDGGFVVAWYTTDTSQDGSGWAVKAQRYDSSGTAVGTEFRVNTTASGSQWKADIVGLTNGGFVVTWQTGNDANSQVYGQLYGADGVKVGGQFVANGSIAYDTLGKVAALPGGGFVVTWMTYDSDSLGIRAQIFNASGSKVGSDFAVNSMSEGVQMDPDVATLADGTILITWYDKITGIKGQAFTASGQRIGGEFLVANGGSANGTGVAVAGLAGGKFAVSFTNDAGTSSGDDIQLQMLQYNSTPSVAPQLGADTLSLSKQENQTSVTQLFATDSDGPYAITYSIVGGTDAARFTLNAVTGTLTFVSAPNYEAPTDSDQNNVYQVIVRASDGENHDQQTISVAVTNTNEALTITSNGAGASAAISVAENKLAVTKVTAVDPDGSPITYSISGGADASRFLIDSSTGALSFLANPDFEQPADSDGNNVYLVTVRASDGTWTDTQALTITVTNANDAPVITSNGGGSGAAVSVVEGALAVTIVAASDLEGAALSYAISGGADASRFLIDSATGALRFLTAPDFEQPADSDGDNVYQVTVRASDGSLSDEQALAITVGNVNEQPVIVSNGGGAVGAIELNEGSTAVTGVVATDPDSGTAFTYAIAGGADAARFAIDPTTGALSFVQAPDFEAPSDEGGDNVYSVTVSASDGVLVGSQALEVRVRDVNEGVTITSGAAQPVVENSKAVMTITAQDLDGDSVSFALSGGADAHLFEIDPTTGDLRFLAAPNFEAPADADGDNVYDVTVSASDGSLSATRALSVTVTNENEAIAFVSGGGGDHVSVTIDENTGPVLGLLAVDPDGGTPFYGIAGGADAALFMLDPVTKALQFRNRPDFETRQDSDGDNVYEVVVGTSDGETYDYQTISVTVANVYEGLSFGSPSSEYSVGENGSQVGIVSAVSGDGSPLTYMITGGEDSPLFSIDAATGALRFVGAPDFESPRDSGGHNIYRLTVAASDGTHSTSQAVTVIVGNVDEEVELLSYGGDETVSLSIAENGAQAGRVEGLDLDGGEVTYSIAGGADSSLFTVDPSTGALSFLSGPDFEAAADSDGDNVYDVAVAASAGGSTATQSFALSVTNLNEGLFITSDGGGASVALARDEGDRHVTTVVANDPDGTAPVYSIVGGADSALFTIDASTGLLRFVGTPDYEAPAHGTNSFEVEVGASDGELIVTQKIQVQVRNVNEGVAITSGGGAEFLAVTVAENGTAVASIAASDADGDEVTYSITGGADSSRFAIDSRTGVLSFVQAANFEAPSDSGGDNVYDVVVSVTDGAFTDSQSVAVAVGNIDEPVEILSYAGSDAVALTVQEGSIAVADVDARDEEDWPVTFAITGGADAALFRVDTHTGALTFKPGVYADFEAPADSGGDNVYDVVVTASSSTSSADQAFAITVADRNEGLWITSDGGGDATVSVDEGSRHVTTVTAFDQDGDAVSYSILGGADAALFAIDPATGVLTFIAAPDFEAPGSGSGTNVYSVEVGASDGEFTGSQKIRVQIDNVNEGVSITSGGGSQSAAYSVGENGLAVTTVAASDVDGDSLTYSIVGGADSALFTIDARTGALRFVQAPNFESPTDQGGNNVYDVVVSVTDGAFTDSQAVAVTVSNVNETLAIVSNGGGASASVAVAENGTAVTGVSALDPDGGAVTYSISGGADAARFRIDPATGALSFLSAPNFEAPADSGANNVYDVIVSASDGSFSDSQAIAVSVGNVNEGVSITSNGAGASASVAVAENGTAVTKVAAVDLDGAAVTYAIAGGLDSARFTIDPATGVLAFVAAPNFEAPSDSGGNNVYDVLVSASDGSFTDTQAIAVAVGNVNEAPAITSNGAGAAAAVSVAENSLAVTVVAATDPDGSTATYSIVGGADAARFTINPQTGALQFVAEPDWELPGDSNQDNVYAVVVRASDGQLVDDQALNVTVSNIRDGNTVTGTSAGDSISATSLIVALRTSNEEDLVFGRDGHDTIFGMAGADEIYGEGGNDVLVGGDGADKLSGGLGKDQFAYNNVSESTAGSLDLITDFSRSQGDKISLSGIDANSLLSANQAFTFIGTSAFSNVAGQLRFETSAGITTVFGDVNGDGVADLQIQLSGAVPLIASDFVL